MSEPRLGLGFFGKSAGNVSTRPKHLIEDISFRKNFITCNCGWHGVIDEYRNHRRDVGAIKKSH